MEAREHGWLYLSSPRMTVIVRVRHGRILDTPPIVRKFIGQPYADLVRWMGKQGALRHRWYD